MGSRVNDHVAINLSRRKVLATSTKALAGASLMALVDPLVKAGAWAAGSDAPEKPQSKLVLSH